MVNYYKNKAAVCVFALPALLVFTIVVFWPILQTLQRSFYEWNGLGSGSFIGTANYERLLEDNIFYTSVKNGLLFALVLVVFQIGIGTVLALAVSDNTFRGKKILRTSYFIPVVLSTTVVCQLWLLMYNSQYGMINNFFSLLGLSYQQDWLNSKATAIFAIAIVNAWQYMGYHFSILFTAIKSIPENYYEAAIIDGAGKFKAHLKVTLPLLAETYRFCLIWAITGGLGAFSQIFIMSNGGPGTMTYTLTFLMYRSAFKMNEFGYGCASAMVLVAEALLATFIINKLVARERITY